MHGKSVWKLLQLQARNDVRTFLTTTAVAATTVALATTAVAAPDAASVTVAPAIADLAPSAVGRYDVRLRRWRTAVAM